MEKINVMLFGPPGSGKGTQSAHLVEKFGLCHISTGDVIRKEVQNETPLAALLQRVKPGELAPDELVINMVENFIIANAHVPGYLFDGFPRTTEQAHKLNSMLMQRGQKIHCVLVLDTTYDVLIPRLQHRAQTEQRKDDQSITSIQRRLDIYYQQTLPVLQCYGSDNTIHILDASDTIQSINSDIESILSTYGLRYISKK